MRDEEFNLWYNELSPMQQSELGVLRRGVHRYARYRRKHPEKSKTWCYEAALAWVRNTEEQYIRRKSHETGAV